MKKIIDEKHKKTTTTTTEHLDSFSHMNVLSSEWMLNYIFLLLFSTKVQFCFIQIIKTLRKNNSSASEMKSIYSHLTLRGKNQTRLFAICVPPPPQLSFLKFLCLYIKNAAWFSMQRIFLFCFSKCYSNMENHFYWPVNIYHMIIIII